MAESIDDLVDRLREQLLSAPDDGTFIHLVVWPVPLDEPLRELLLDMTHTVNPAWSVYASPTSELRSEYLTHVVAVRSDRRIKP